MTGAIACEMGATMDACAAAKEAHAAALSKQIASLSEQVDVALRDAAEFRRLRSQLDLIVGGLDAPLPAGGAQKLPGSIPTRVMNLFQQDRTRGWTSRQVVDAMAPTKPANVRSVLSRAVKDGVLVRDGELYRLPGLTVVGEPAGGDRQATM